MRVNVSASLLLHVDLYLTTLVNTIGKKLSQKEWGI